MGKILILGITLFLRSDFELQELNFFQCFFHLSYLMNFLFIGLAND